MLRACASMPRGLMCPGTPTLAIVARSTPENIGQADFRMLRNLTQR